MRHATIKDYCGNCKSNIKCNKKSHGKFAIVRICRFWEEGKKVSVPMELKQALSGKWYYHKEAI